MNVPVSLIELAARNRAAHIAAHYLSHAEGRARTRLLHPSKSSAYPIVTRARSPLRTFDGHYGTPAEWTFYHAAGKWPFRGCSLHFQASRGFDLRLLTVTSVRAGNVEALVSPVPAVMLHALDSLDMPVLRRRMGMEVRFKYFGHVLPGCTRGEGFQVCLEIDGHESRWHETSYGRRMYRYRELGEGRRV
jgi:hypothetical protein